MGRYTQKWLSEAGDLLRCLPGVFAARVLADEGGEKLEAIHLLTGEERHAKQIVRDVQSALSAAYAIDVDHRIIGVAQMPVDPFGKKDTEEIEETHTDCPSARPQFCGITVEEFCKKTTVRVSLEYAKNVYEGSASGRAGSPWREQLTAQATLDAVAHLPGQENAYALLSVQSMQTPLMRLSIVLVEHKEDGLILTGAATVEEGSVHGVVRATLDAVNRHLTGRLIAEQNGRDRTRF